MKNSGISGNREKLRLDAPNKLAILRRAPGSPGTEAGGFMLNRAGLWLAFSAVLLGCGEIGVQPATEPDVLDTWEASNGTGEELSPRSLQTIRRLDLEPLYHHRPIEAFDQLQTLAVEHPRPDIVVFTVGSTSVPRSTA